MEMILRHSDSLPAAALWHSVNSLLRYAPRYKDRSDRNI